MPGPAGDASSMCAPTGTMGELSMGTTVLGPAGEESGIGGTTTLGAKRRNTRVGACLPFSAATCWGTGLTGELTSDATGLGSCKGLEAVLEALRAGAAASAATSLWTQAGAGANGRCSLATSGRTPEWTDQAIPCGQSSKPGEAPCCRANCCRASLKSWKSVSLVVEPRKYSASRRRALSAACDCPPESTGSPNHSKMTVGLSGEVTNCANKRKAAAEEADVTGISPSAF